MWITDWTTRAACKGTDPDELFVQGAAQNRAKLICRGCPVRTECLADALDNGIEFGVWGGMTERERRALLRRRPDVTSWRDLLERARDQYERQGFDGLIDDGSDVRERPDPPAGLDTSPPEPFTAPLTTAVNPLRRRWRTVRGIQVLLPKQKTYPRLLEDRPDRRRHHDDAAAREHAADPAPPGPTEDEVRQRCDDAYTPLFVFLALAGLPYAEARAAAQATLVEAYQQGESAQFSALRLRQLAQAHLQRRPSPAPAQPAFPASVSIPGQKVLVLVADLPEPQRVALAWAADGRSPAYIANGTGHSLEAVLENLKCGRSALKDALGVILRNESPDDGDELCDADLDGILMEVADELTYAIEEADITAVTEEIMAAIRPGWSCARPVRQGRSACHRVAPRASPYAC